MISMLQGPTGRVLKDENKIRGLLFNSFQERWARTFVTNHIMPPMALKISSDQNEKLIIVVTDEEVKIAINSMQSNKTLGLDRFQMLLFQEFWPIIKKDVVLAIKNSLE